MAVHAAPEAQSPSARPRLVDRAQVIPHGRYDRIQMSGDPSAARRAPVSPATTPRDPAS